MAVVGRCERQGSQALGVVIVGGCWWGGGGAVAVCVSVGLERKLQASGLICAVNRGAGKRYVR